MRCLIIILFIFFFLDSSEGMLVQHRHQERIYRTVTQEEVPPLQTQKALLSVD